eukprot:610613-Amphidinium_carterae.1
MNEDGAPSINHPRLALVLRLSPGNLLLREQWQDYSFNRETMETFRFWVEALSALSSPLVSVKFLANAYEHEEQFPILCPPLPATKLKVVHDTYELHAQVWAHALSRGQSQTARSSQATSFQFFPCRDT